MAIGDVLAALMGAAGNGLQTYGQYQIAKQRADADDEFQRRRIEQAEAELRERNQERLHDRMDRQAERASASLERAGIFGAQPALDALAGSVGNRVQGQDSASGAIQDFQTDALSALSEASQGGIDQYQVTDLGEGRFFVPPNLGKPEKPVMGSEEWLSALSALAAARADEQIRVNQSKPQPVTAQRTADTMLQSEIDRFVAEAGGDPNQAMSRYFQQKRLGSAQSPEEAQELSGLSTRFNASAQNLRNKTLTQTVRDPVSGSSATMRGDTKIPLSAVPRAQRRQWAQEAGLPATNSPENIARMKEWIRANHPEVDLSR